MRRPMAKKVLAATLTAAMTMSLAACGESAAPAATPAPEPAAEPATDAASEAEEEEEVSPYTVIKDANGDVVDLDGMEVHFIQWWSSDDTETTTTYATAVKEYREWAQETYNFTWVWDGSGDWGQNAQNFVDYVSTNGDENAYIWLIHSNDATFISACKNGLAYDVSSLDCMDLKSAKYAGSACSEGYTFGGKVYGFRAQPAEPRTGVYFNKRLLTEAGINPDDIYDMQANDTWTWDAFEKLVAQAQRDTDNDGNVDIWGICANESVGTDAAVHSNGGVYVGKDADGKFTYNIEDPNTVEALEWMLRMYQTYDWDGPVDDTGATNWEYYKDQFKNGGAAFLLDQEYCASPGNLFADMEELGFVMFPKGPHGSLVQAADDNVAGIPACYDADKAWKIAFAYDVIMEPVPGFENTNEYCDTARQGNFDQRAVDETIPMMCSHSMLDFYGLIPNNGDFMNADFRWAIGPNGTKTISELIDGKRDIAKQYIADANAAE